MKTAYRKIVLLSFLLLCFLPVFSQSHPQKGFIKAVQDADIFYYYDQNYDKAAGLYENLVKNYPDNSNLLAKLGICYLNLDGKNTDALKLLSKAILNVVASDNEYKEYGNKAPLDTWLYLAIAYHQNDSLRKAIELYTDARKRLNGTKVFREEYIDNQIKDCRYAIEMIKKSVPVNKKLFTEWLKDYPGASNPVLSKNDSVFIFTEKINGSTHIFCSYRGENWKRPVDISKQLGGSDKMYSNSITADGKYMIVYMDVEGDGNLFYTQRKDSVWSKIKNIGKPISTIYWQAHGFITPDGKKLYFSSNRPGGYGELDIWYSEKNAAGRWGDPVNCGNVINTPYNEDTPFFDPETSTLLFSSIGHLCMGGYDMFRSVKKNGSWTKPTGLPYSLNNTLSNTFFIENNSNTGYISSLYDNTTKSRNIYSITSIQNAHKSITAKGDIELQDGMAVNPSQIKIVLIDSSKRSRSIELSDSSEYSFDISPGDYQLLVKHTGYKTDTVNLSVPKEFNGTYIFVSSSLLPEKVYVKEFLTIKNILFDYDSYKLSDEAISNLEYLRSVLINYPELKVEITGYTDDLGSKEYNQMLADKRAQTVIDYLTKNSSSSGKFIKKAYGKSEYIALNSNKDGSDNPEGRKYNRRVSFGIVDPKTGIIIRQESYTPEHLMNPYSIRYNIVLLKTNNNIASDYFKSLTDGNLLFIRTIKSDSASLYVLGVFYNKSDALKYLGFAREKGFEKAYILNQYELEKESETMLSPDAKQTILKNVNQKTYTIQMGATKHPININKIFNGISGVSEIKAVDGLYKYYHGEYPTFTEAREALNLVHKAGYEDAFIRNLYQLMTQ